VRYIYWLSLVALTLFRKIFGLVWNKRIGSMEFGWRATDMFQSKMNYQLIIGANF